MSQIIRSNRPKEFFYILDKRISEDSLLSWEARGLLIYLLGKPDNWRINVAHLVSEGSAGRDKVYRMINELIDRGYCRRVKGVGGFGFDYFIYEKPMRNDLQKQAPYPGNPYPENPYPDSPTLISNENNQVSKINNRKNIQKEIVLDWSKINLSEDDKRDVQDLFQSRLTQKALDGVITELNLANSFGISYQLCLDEWATRSWKTFKAAWMLKVVSKQRLASNDS